LFAESNPVPVKGGLGLLGLCDWKPRLPLTRASDAVLAELEGIFGELMLMEDSIARSAMNRRHAAGLNGCKAPLPAGAPAGLAERPSASEMDDVLFR
jgi:4-hydroxy-tetrahydrodipicolinate synthase